MSDRSRGEPRTTAYDVVIAGGGMGGLTTGALLARAGKKVLVVDDQELPGGHARALRHDGLSFDSAVHLIARCGQSPVLGSGIVDALLRHLGVRDRCEFLRVGDPFYTTRFPDLQVSVPTGREAFLAAHARHFPGEAQGLRRLHELCVEVARELGGFPDDPRLGDLLLSRWRTPTVFRYRNATLQQVMDRELRDPRLKAVYTTLWPWIGSPPWSASFVVWADMMAQYIEDGAYYCRGGYQTLANAVTEALERAGGELVLGTKVMRIVSKNRRATGVILDSGQQIHAPLVISNIDPRVTFEQLLSEGEAPGWLVRKLRRLELTPSALAAYTTTDLDVRSLGVGHETICNGTWDIRRGFAAGLTGELSGISVTIPTLTDPSLAPAGQHVVILMALAPVTRQATDAELADRMMRLAEPVLPGLGDHLTSILGAPVGSRELALRRIETIYGFALTPRQVGVKRLPQRTPIEGLHLVGQWTRPGPGVPWTMESAIQVAGRILGHVPAAETLPHRLRPAISAV